MQISVKEAIQLRERVIFFLEKQVRQLNNIQIDDNIEDFEASILLQLLKTER